MDTHDHDFPPAEWPFDDAVNVAAVTTTRVAREEKDAEADHD